MASTSVARSVRDWIDTHPVVRDALAMGIVNLSALTRRIQDDTGIDQEEAVLVACRRYRPKERSLGYEDAIRKVLDQSKLEVRTRVAVITMRNSWRLMGRLDKAISSVSNDPVHVLHGSESVTIIIDEAMATEMEETLGKEEVLKRTTGLVEVNMRSPSLIEDVPGTLSFLVSSLSDRGINLLQVISCHKDNMFIVEKDDLYGAMEVLNGLIRS